MININFSFSLSDLPFYIIPKIIPFKRNKIKGVMIRWLTFQLIVDNSRMCRIEVESCLQMGYTLLFDSFSKSSELINIIDENECIVDTLGMVTAFIDANNPFEKERDKSKPHIICDIPQMNIWKQNQLKNIITKEVFHEEIDDSGRRES